MTPRTEAEEFEYWNKLLAKEGLTVDRGRFPTGKRVSLSVIETEGKEIEDLERKGDAVVTFDGKTSLAYKRWLEEQREAPDEE